MELFKEVERVLKLKVRGEKWIEEALPVLVEVVKQMAGLESGKAEEMEPFKTVIKGITDKYAVALKPLAEMDEKLRERVLVEHKGVETVKQEGVGQLVFPATWGYEIPDVSKLDKRYLVTVPNDKLLKAEIKAGIRNIKGVEIKQTVGLRVLTKEAE